MKIKGKLHRITNLKTFLGSFVQTKGKPTQGFSQWGNARIHLATDLPSGKFNGGFVPSMSFKTQADAQGEFAFDTGSALDNFRGQIVAYRTTMAPPPLPGLAPIPILDPVYRSQPFKFADVPSKDGTRNIYVYEHTTDEKQGISQTEVDAQLTALKKQLALDKLRGTILSNRVSVTAEKSGGDVKFSAFVRGSTSEDLGRVIEIKAGEIALDLPGPDAIVGLCVDEEQIETQIRKGLSNLSKTVSKQLLDEFEKQAPGAGSLATVSVWRTRYPQAGTKSIKVPGAPPVTVPVFAVVPDAALGVPRQVF